MSDDLKTLVAQEVAKQLAAVTPSQDVLKTLRFLTSPPVVPITESKVLTINDFNRVLMYTTPSNTASSIELTLPAPADCVGKQVTVLNIGFPGSVVTVRPNSSEQFYGNLWSASTAYQDLRNGSSMTLISDGINWMVVNGGSVDAIAEGGGYANEIVSAWYKKLQSGMVWMGGTAALNGTTSIQISLPTALKENDWPIVVATPLWSSASDIPQVSYDQVSTTGFTLYSSKSAVVVWHAYGYWR